MLLNCTAVRTKHQWLNVHLVKIWVQAFQGRCWESKLGKTTITWRHVAAAAAALYFEKTRYLHFPYCSYHLYCLKVKTFFRLFSTWKCERKTFFYFHLSLYFGCIFSTKIYQEQQKNKDFPMDNLFGSCHVDVYCNKKAL